MTGGMHGWAQHFSLVFSLFKLYIPLGIWSTVLPLLLYSPLKVPLLSLTQISQFMLQSLAHQSVFSCPMILSIFTL